MPGWVYKLLPALTTVVWGLGYVVTKSAMEVLPPAWLVAIRAERAPKAAHSEITPRSNESCLLRGFRLKVWR